MRECVSEKEHIFLSILSLKYYIKEKLLLLTIFTVTKVSKYVITLFREGDLVNSVSDETSLQ